MDDNVVKFPSNETCEDVLVERVLEGAKDLASIVILGWDGEEFYFATSQGDARDIFELLALANYDLSRRYFE